MWVVRRIHDQLVGLPPDQGAAPHPDHSIVIPAMAEYIRFTGTQIGMPTIWLNGRQERLRDGVQLLQALQLAGHTANVFCLWLSKPSLAAPGGGEPFGPVWEQRTGSNARLLTFESPLDTAQQDQLRSAWGVPSREVGELSWGWSAQQAASLPDWLTWMRAVSKLLPPLPQVVAVNGRHAVFPPVD
jgi:hypothetical protein